MTSRRASCACGQLSLVCQGQPVRVSMCHCLACQQRTGSVFGVQARFAGDQVSQIEGTQAHYTRVGDSGNSVVFHFCPQCGSTLYWELAALPEFIVVAVGAFADPNFPEPQISIYEARRHDWTRKAEHGQVEHWD